MGDNPNSAIVVAVAIAFFKGIFRPMFTMMDKKSDTKTKKSAAIREGLTEGIAIPVYIAVPMISEKLIIDNFFKGKEEVIKKAVKTNVKFIGVLASTAIIPAVCNLVQPPIMEALKKGHDKKNIVNAPVVSTVSKPSFSSSTFPKRISNNTNYGMRVGS